MASNTAVFTTVILLTTLHISVGNNIILQYIALLVAYYTSAILRIAISY